MLNVDACGVHLKVVVRRRIAEVLRLDFAAIDGIPGDGNAKLLTGFSCACHVRLLAGFLSSRR
ncbi:Uncharacterised protein [Klebsiella pneumoniae]|nr:Uncharacterised protein [Klebsiella pneumoniae]